MKIFIGYDPRESVSYHVCSHSILRRSSIPVEITPLALCNLPDFRRPRNPLQSTDFSFTRFLVPYLSGYHGWSLFMDCDMLCRVDMKEMARLCNGENYYKSVFVVKHDYTPKDKDTKFLGEKQTPYEKKNWSSVMLFNNTRCKILDPDLVNQASGLYLHQFQWTDEDQIGNLDKDWNHLVGEEPENPNAKIVHFTRGGPWFKDYSKCEFSKEWFTEFENMKWPA